MALDFNLSTTEMLNQWIVSFIFGHNVKRTEWVSRHGAAEVIDQAKVEGIRTGGSQTDQVYCLGVFQERFDYIDIQFRLPSA